ncbi:membrane protein insertase YidC [Luteimicrobium xylanilyticum]|uniref:Membrane protein insertase YidC n=1 Tax=Luteimicrobium xylanilyticum TaxID=1133546 RepID=A0A5P9Q5A7_9MICO|nr:membrane protein insertase YidC [Luteimicrobium xylanilyticum]QFU96519.1 Membrane protein insertase YidC [Luteimicrobium xylanilyticum]
MFDTILGPIEWAVAWIMYACHWVLTHVGFSEGPSFAWVLSIVGLVIVIRIILIPLFFRQIRASRGMQMMQPELQAIQKKYKGKSDPASREALSRETMALYRKHGTNPFASCLPILLQSPIFFALFRVLNHLPDIADGKRGAIGPINASVAHDVETSQIFGAQLSDVFKSAEGTNAKVAAAILIIAMCATTFFTQRQLTMKNMPKAALQGPMAQTQKLMLWGYPVVFAISGINFPIGVLVYWTTTNLWSMGQQFYTIKRMPAPGSEAERIYKEKKAARDRAKGIIPEEPLIIEAPRGQRQQPKRKDRNKGPAKPATAGIATGDADAENASAPSEAPTPSQPSAPKGPAGGKQAGPNTGSGNNPQKRPAGPGSGKKRKKR